MSSLVGELESIVGPDGCLHRPEELLVYECDGSTLHSGKPSAVVLPRSREEVCGVVSTCRAHGVPFVPRGAGTGLSGGAVANDGAVIIECSRMNRILEVNVEDRYAIVEPGVINADLSKRTLEHGLFYAPDPSSQLVCTIGGNVAENSGGPHTLKYGTTTNHVLAIELVLPDASVVHLGSPSGFAPGYNLVGAVVGSEGTLGIVTQVTVRRVETLLVSFPDVVTACRAVGGIIESGLTPAALEIIDRRTIAALEASVYAAGLPADAGAVLIVELDGAAIALPSQVERVKQISTREGATQVEVAADESERQRFWRARKGAFGAMGRLAPDLYVHDAVVPRSKLPEVLDEICAIGDRYELTLSNVFHAGDGNLHPNISFDRRDPDVLERVIAAGSEILECCVRAGGVITGEHGIGNEKREFLHLVFSEADMDAMKEFRDCFNPDGICNPGKIFPTTRFCVESNPKSRGYDRIEFD
ncbi:MAG: FAD-binding protein [Deltaproteobacteria bacterium]|nr:FAD-binding protein [Deltaproteobacteria bacterium]